MLNNSVSPPNTLAPNRGDPSADTPPPAPPRPYNSYNLFFQLEREYILQTHLGHRPSLAGREAFDPATADVARYPYPYPDGPSLPARYRRLVLPHDWHVPGKGRRRKRSHRRTHGKIGFRELSDRVSRQWSAAGADVREFCARLADMQTRAYRESKRKAKAGCATRRRAGIHMTTTKTSEKSHAEDRGQEDGRGNNATSSFDWLSFSSLSNSNPEGFAANAERLEDGARSGSSDAALAEVEMADSDILDLWHRSPSSPSRCDDAVHAALFLSLLDDFALAAAAQKNEKDRHIDAEYERYLELGKRRAATRRKPRGTPPARTLPRPPTQREVAARQA